MIAQVVSLMSDLIKFGCVKRIALGPLCFFAAFVLISCVGSREDGITEGRLRLFPENSKFEETVPMEFWAKIVKGQDDSLGPDSLSFRSRESLATGKSITVLPIDQQTGETQDSPSFAIRVTPIAFYEGSVALEIEVMGRGGDGKDVKLSSPRIIAPYGESSEIREINPGNAASFSDLKISLFVGRPTDSNPQFNPVAPTARAP